MHVSCFRISMEYLVKGMSKDEINCVNTEKKNSIQDMTILNNRMIRAKVVVDLQKKKRMELSCGCR